MLRRIRLLCCFNTNRGINVKRKETLKNAKMLNVRAHFLLRNLEVMIRCRLKVNGHSVGRSQVSFEWLRDFESRYQCYEERKKKIFGENLEQLNCSNLVLVKNKRWIFLTETCSLINIKS